MSIAESVIMGAIRHILVPVDGSPASLAALEHAVTLASDYDAKVEVLHVIPIETPLAMRDEEAERGISAAIVRAREALGGLVTYRTASGEPLREIVRAGRSGVDLIVMGTHGRIGRLHSLLGSVAEGVVRNAACPVMTVRDPGGGYQSFAEYRHGRPSIADHRSTR
jgi:nucleotide-binding universal stress UspA family protein